MGAAGYVAWTAAVAGDTSARCMSANGMPTRWGATLYRCAASSALMNSDGSGRTL